MNLQLSTEAWAAVGCLAGVVLFSGAILWGAWRRGMRSQPPAHSTEKVAGPSFNRNWAKEETQFAELARKADELRALRAEQAEQSGDKNQQG